MNKKAFYFFSIIGILMSVFICQIIYLSSIKTITPTMLSKKLAFVKIVGLPDLAISTEVSYIRHRSLANIFDIYSNDGVLREYTSSTFTYSHSGIINDKK